MKDYLFKELERRIRSAWEWRDDKWDLDIEEAIEQAKKDLAYKMVDFFCHSDGSERQSPVKDAL